MRRTALPICIALIAAFCTVCLLAGAAIPPAHAQQSDREYIANLATGRVIICVTHEAVLVGAVSEKSEPGAHPPLFVPLTGGHVAVLLGAVEWIELNSHKPSVRMDVELSIAANRAQHPIELTTNMEAGDIEGLGVEFLARLRETIDKLHHPLELKSDEPIVQLVVAGYEKDYGPEAWLVSYRVKQTMLKDDYWDIQVQHPSYVQLYPPEKGEPRTLIEVRYPSNIKGPTLLEMLGQNDARLIPVRKSDPKVGQAAQQIFDGASNKAASDPATVFVKGAIIATITPENKPALAILRDGEKFDWVIPPPESFEKALDDKRDPNAPTLRAPHHQ
ncbi:MAG TPA: hypothetical protein VGZ48_09245 [Candidatus Acidoferrales bacterium]|jgi:hypothetical protein|nr:hypothetical protein [Candidatus Acidoferrales bacterium]